MDVKEHKCHLCMNGNGLLHCHSLERVLIISHAAKRSGNGVGLPGPECFWNSQFPEVVSRSMDFSSVGQAAAAYI